MIQLKRSGAVDLGTEEEIDALRRAFESDDWVRLPQLMDLASREFVREGLEQGEYYERVHDGMEDNLELCLLPCTAVSFLNFMLNSQELFRVVSAVTGCGRIGSFTGRVYRLAPGAGHHDAWHDDLGGNRLVALSLNLSGGEYEGGLLEMRKRDADTALRAVENVVDGDAIMFRLADDLQHRVTDVVGTHPKTAFAGWFRSKPEAKELLFNISGTV